MEKRRCGECIYLKKLKKDGALCSESGKNKGCSACKNWEPDIELLSPNIKEIINLLGDCDLFDIPVLKWVLKKQQTLLESGKNNPLFRIGKTVWYSMPSCNEGGEIYQICIQNVTSKYAIGTGLENGTCFFLPLDTKVFASKQDLLAERQRIAELKQQLPKKCLNDSGVGFVRGRVKDGTTQRDE